MTDEANVKGSPRQSERFAQVEDELRKEDTLVELFKEQWVGMTAMAGMFVVTIALASFIRPYYDVGELKAFGSSGASQVRYVAIELFAIFMFTALIILLAKYKKDYIIKYGMMVVLTLALLYSTIPLAHVALLDFDPVPFEMDQQDTIEGDYLGTWGDDGFVTATLIREDVGMNVTVSAWSVSSGMEEPVWTMTHNHSLNEPDSRLRMATSDDVLTFTSGPWVWTVDAQTGELIQSYACFEVDENGMEQPITSMITGCALAVKTSDAMYLFNTASEVIRFNTFEEYPGNLTYQAKWYVPSIDFKNGILHAELLSDTLLFLATPSATGVLHLDEYGSVNDPLTPQIGNDIRMAYLQNSTSGFTSTAVGISPFAASNASSLPDDQRMLILGEENGDITGIEWNGSAVSSEEFVIQDRMMLNSLVESVSSIQIIDWDANGYSDLVVTGENNAYFLYGTSLANVGSFPVSADSTLTLLSAEPNAEQLLSLTLDETDLVIDLQSGSLEEDMFPLIGLQLRTGPTMIGLAITAILMILLYVHSEWYVVNTTGVLLGAGVCALLGVSFEPPMAILFMILAAVYDAWAVYKSKHMLDLADTMIGLRLPILLVAPQDTNYSLIEETENTPTKRVISDKVQTKRKKKPSTEAMFMGLGDIIFPGMLVLSALQYLDPSAATQVAISTLIGGLVGYFALMSYVARGKAQAGLPLLNGGAIMGYFIGGFLFLGNEILQFNISW
jgi:presenilin-like A22 family membrane protease